MLGMRTARGIDAQDVRADAHVLERLQGAGLIVVQGGRVVPTVRGMLFADRLPLVL
jgi:hypothetical protein